MHAVFIELPPFERHRETYLDDDAFRRLQAMLVMHPEAGDVIPGAGGPAQAALRRRAAAQG